jgi:ankyrin repeat protein
MELLLSKGAPIQTAMITAAENGQTEAVSFLIEKGADINVLNVVKRTPLNAAVCAGKTSVVKLLLTHSADIGIKDDLQHNPLVNAILSQNVEITKLLTEHIDVTLKLADKVDKLKVDS